MKCKCKDYAEAAPLRAEIMEMFNHGEERTIRGIYAAVTLEWYDSDIRSAVLSLIDEGKLDIDKHNVIRSHRE